MECLRVLLNIKTSPVSFTKFAFAIVSSWHKVLDGVPEGWCPALAVWWSGGVAGVAHRFQNWHISLKDTSLVFVLSPSDSGRPRGGWARFTVATGQGRFSSSRTASGLNWLVEKGKWERILKTSQELRMLSSVTINCQITKIVMNSGSQLSEL